MPKIAWSSLPGIPRRSCNEEAGAVWFKRLKDAYPRTVWLNPEHEDRWEYTPSIQATLQLIGEDRMFPLTLAGLDRSIRRLTH